MRTLSSLRRPFVTIVLEQQLISEYCFALRVMTDAGVKRSHSKRCWVLDASE